MQVNRSIFSLDFNMEPNPLYVQTTNCTAVVDTVAKTFGTEPQSAY